MKWVNENINVFGGDRNKVTLFGESAGAASVGYHLVNAESTKYFRRAIMHSGSQLCPWAYMRPDNVQKRAKALFAAVGCDQSAAASLLECLRRVPAGDFVDKDWVISNMMFFPWVPTNDGDFVRQNPLKDLLSRSPSMNKELIMATNKDEGTFWIVYNFRNQFSKEKNWINITRDELKSDFDALTADLPATKQAIYADYTRSGAAGDGRYNAKLLDFILGDRHFTCPAESFVYQYPVKDKFYLQYYYRDSRETWPPWMGVIHGADCQVRMITYLQQGYANSIFSATCIR